MAKSVLTGLFFLYGTIANRVSDAAASVITRISTRNLLPVPVTVTLAFALLSKITARENRQQAVGVPDLFGIQLSRH
jgi:hypothetical protein